ncbi:MAG: DUF4276 family protein [Nitrospinae bacterium]|nr:DUF4276 family protein [Nitrospinota bacterium]
MREIVFFLEELSAVEMLKGILPKIMPEDCTCRYVPFEGKSDLEKQLLIKLRSYQKPDARFVILRDKDAGDCKQIKAKLLDICAKSGKSDFIVRIACHELESWYLADLAAVERGLGIKGLVKRYQERNPYRQPDNLPSPSKKLSEITTHRYQKLSGSRLIGPHLDIANTRSKSFSAFVEGVYSDGIDLTVAPVGVVS